MHQGGRGIDEIAKQLIVPGSGESEFQADRLLLRPGVLPPLALEVEDLQVALAERWLRFAMLESLHGYPPFDELLANTRATKLDIP